MLWFALVVHTLLATVVKIAYEVTYTWRRDATDITLSQAEEIRKTLRYPVMDIFVTCSPILGGLLLPEGFQGDVKYVHLPCHGDAHIFVHRHHPFSDAPLLLPPLHVQ